MSEKKDIAFLLKTFSLKQNTAQFDLIDFCLFVQRYSAKFCDRHPELADYTNVGTEEMAGYLREMKNDGEIEYIQHSTGMRQSSLHIFISKKLIKYLMLFPKSRRLRFRRGRIYRRISLVSFCENLLWTVSLPRFSRPMVTTSLFMS